MASTTESDGRRPGSRWRLAAWAMGAAVLLLPLVAMQFTDEVNWDLADFAFAGALVACVGVLSELAVRRTSSRAYRAAAGVALATAFILVWANAAVGLIARFRPRGMARALVATALAQMLVAVIALIAGLGSAGPITAFFTALWLLSAWLFRKAARE
jgi:hypothetical protein